MIHGRVDIRFARKSGRVLEFAVCLVLLEQGREFEVVRYDSAHGQAHVHRFHASDPSRLREVCPGPSLNDALTWAMADLRENSAEYLQAFRRNVLGTE